jgi:hypothetical protein
VQVNDDYSLQESEKKAAMIEIASKIKAHLVGNFLKPVPLCSIEMGEIVAVTVMLMTLRVKQCNELCFDNIY